ncbi:MAG: cytochrome C oxidase subunit IV family protein [Bdellovibrionota bacterium]
MTTMSHEHAQSYQEKLKIYLRVAAVLAVITAIEVSLTFVPHHDQPMKTFITMLIVAFSCSKAFFVAYYYMHLNHEHKWTKIVAASPIVILIYAAALIADTPSRPMYQYFGEHARGVMYPTRTAAEGHDVKPVHPSPKTSDDPLSDDLDAAEAKGWE